MKKNGSGKVYFPGLNGLRFFAAFAVIFTHIELIKMAFGVRHHWYDPLFFDLGGLGVYFFFVLSGFLITYLLLAEKDISGGISVKKFYLRRMFRMWPLYYLIFLIGFVVLPHIHSMDIPYLKFSFDRHYWLQFFSYLMLFPNLGYAMHGPVPHIGQLWTIGVEEQFYILWPLLIKYSKKHRGLLLWLILILFAVKAFVLFVWNTGIRADYWLVVLKAFLAIQDGIHILYALLFIIIILHISSNRVSFIKLDNKLLNYLGQHSYGIYMYHLMLIPLALSLFVRFGLNPGASWLLNILFYACVIALTIGVSILSYHFFESFFLKLKKQFTIVKNA